MAGVNPQGIIERPDSSSTGQAISYGRAYLTQYGDPQVSITFRVTGRDGWRVGQTVYITDSALSTTQTPLSGTGYEIKEVRTDVGFGNGVMTYDITCNTLLPSAARRLGRGQRSR